MLLRSQIRCLRVYPLAIPLRRPFRHAARVRTEADPVLIEAELADGTLGYGETLPRSYVSGESVETLLRFLKDELVGLLVDCRPAVFPEALEQIEALPFVDRRGETMTAARAGVELALLDAYSRHFRKPIAEAVGWFGLPGLGSPGSLGHVRYSGVLSADGLRGLAWSVRRMRWYGLRDFKLKVGGDDDVERIREVARVLGRSLGRSCTLRLDANGAWTVARAVEVLRAVRDVEIRCVEQPFPRGREQDIPLLKEQVPACVMHDESLVTPEEADRLVAGGLADAFNIRISKNGGFLPALRVACLARRHGVLFQLGCMVGETSLLSAVGRRFLEHVPGVTFAEGSYGRFLLRSDIVRRPVGFGYGGRPRVLAGPGWGVDVEPELLRRHVRPGMVELAL